MNDHAYDIPSFGSGVAGQQAAIAAVKLGEKLTVIDLREVLNTVAPRDRMSMREAILCLAVSVLRSPRTAPASGATTDWRSRMRTDVARETTKPTPHSLWLKRSQRSED
jgi:hypothetical protein